MLRYEASLTLCTSILEILHFAALHSAWQRGIAGLLNADFYDGYDFLLLLVFILELEMDSLLCTYLGLLAMTPLFHLKVFHKNKKVSILTIIFIYINIIVLVVIFSVC